MNLSEIKEELVEKLKDTTEIEILAGKLEKVFIPWFLEKTNSSDKSIEECLEELRRITATNLTKFLTSSEIGESLNKYAEAQKHLSDLNEKLALLSKVQKLIQWKYFRDYRTLEWINENNELKHYLSELKENFRDKLSKVFDSQSIDNFCSNKKSVIAHEIKSLENSNLVEKNKIQDSFKEIRDKNEEIICLTNNENALRFVYRALINKKMKDNNVEIQSIRFYLINHFEESEFYLSHFLKPEQKILPKYWRKHLNKTLSEKIPNFSGHINFNRFEKVVSKLSSVDYSYLLALKSALNYQIEIITDDNEIFLALSGGMMAKICFKEKSSFVETFQQKETEIYYQKNDNSNYKNLYSYVSIEYPNKWFLLTKEFVTEISFESAPILFGNASIAEVATAKQIEEEEEEERARLAQEADEEEERRRRFN